ncbi:MAG: hypothetical protein QE263_00045 [Vampirovibrionales bacterium]|nr:hypothetical protein [Vampirovibrionales bacterium]
MAKLSKKGFLSSRWKSNTPLGYPKDSPAATQPAARQGGFVY